MSIEAQKQIDTLMISESITAAETATAQVDCKDAAYATIRIAFNAEVNTGAVGPTISVLHSDTTDSTNFSTIVADRAAEDLTTSKIVRYDIDRRGLKRWLKLSITAATHTTNDIVQASAILSLTRNKAEPSATNAAIVVV